MKKIIAVLLLLSTLVCSVPAVYAAEVPEVPPCSTYIESIDAGLSISSNTATCTSMFRLTSSHRVRLVMYLQQYVNGRWDTIMTWEKTGTAYASLNKTKSVTSGGTYRVHAVGYVLDANGVILEGGRCIDP